PNSTGCSKRSKPCASGRQPARATLRTLPHLDLAQASPPACSRSGWKGLTYCYRIVHGQLDFREISLCTLPGRTPHATALARLKQAFDGLGFFLLGRLDVAPDVLAGAMASRFHGKFH